MTLDEKVERILPKIADGANFSMWQIAESELGTQQGHQALSNYLKSLDIIEPITHYDHYKGVYIVDEMVFKLTGIGAKAAEIGWSQHLQKIELNRKKDETSIRNGRITKIIIAIIALIPVMYGISLTDRSNTLEKELKGLVQQRDTLLMRSNDQKNLLETKDNLIENQNVKIQSLSDSIAALKKPKGKRKNP